MPFQLSLAFGSALLPAADRRHSVVHSIVRAAAAALVIVMALIVSAAWGSRPVGAQRQPVPSCDGLEATIVAERGEATVGTDDADVIVGTHGPDLIDGAGGDDVICGLGGSDRIRGGAGDDNIRGGRGGDRLMGGRGRDILTGNGGPDDLRGGMGRDDLRGRRGIDRCDGGPGRNRERSCEHSPETAPTRIVAIGDSVMLGASAQYCNELQRAVPGVIEDAVTSRQFITAPGIVDAAVVPDEVTVYVVGLGTNGPFSEETFDAVFEADPHGSFVFVNIRAPRSYEAGVNQAIEDGVSRHGERATLVDWHGLAVADPSLTGGDGIHLTCAGAAVYADAVAAGLSALA